MTKLKFDFIKKPFNNLIAHISIYSFSAYLVSPVFERMIYKILNDNVENFLLRLNYWFICVLIIASCSIITSIAINFIYKLLSKLKTRWTIVIIIIIMIIDCFLANVIEYRKNYYSWNKYYNSPVVGDAKTGTLFDPDIIYDNGIYRLYVSKRSEGSIVLYESNDGIHFENEEIVILKPNSKEFIINRASVLKYNDQYYMYYTQQRLDNKINDYKYSAIYLATSKDGINFDSDFERPVITYTEDYEKTSVMNPDVIYDEKEKVFKCYYAAGETFEPDVICYATSKDGYNWIKYEKNPIFVKNEDVNSLDSYKVGATDIHYINNKYYMFYIGYTDLQTARIFLATSEDGINWVRNGYNPIVEPTKGNFDADATYKPAAIYDSENKRWLLYYNGRKGPDEYIGLVIKNGELLK